MIDSVTFEKFCIFITKYTDNDLTYILACIISIILNSH